MRVKRSGTTGQFISTFCLGTMGSATPAPQDAAAGDLRDMGGDAPRAACTGIDFSATPHVHAHAEAEGMRTNHAACHDVVIAAKAQPAGDAGPNDAGTWRHHTSYQERQSLGRLDTHNTDLYQSQGGDPETNDSAARQFLADTGRPGDAREVRKGSH